MSHIYLFAYICSDVFESLAWASAQVHCQCSTNGKVVFTDKIISATKLAAVNASKDNFTYKKDNFNNDDDDGENNKKRLIAIVL